MAKRFSPSCVNRSPVARVPDAGLTQPRPSLLCSVAMKIKSETGAGLRASVGGVDVVQCTFLTASRHSSTSREG